MQEICTKYGMLNICDEEYPSEGSPEAKVNGPGSGTKDRNR